MSYILFIHKYICVYTAIIEYSHTVLWCVCIMLYFGINFAVYIIILFTIDDHVRQETINRTALIEEVLVIEK